LISENIEVAMKCINELDDDLEDFKHVKWHTVTEFFYELKEKLEANSYKILDFPDNEKITAVIHKKNKIDNSLVIKFENADFFYIANDDNGLTYSEVGNEKEYQPFSKEIKFYDFTNEETFNLINSKHRAEIIKEIVDYVKDYVKRITKN
jgi:hypothetical protein